VDFAMSMFKTAFVVPFRDALERGFS